MRTELGHARKFDHMSASVRLGRPRSGMFCESFVPGADRCYRMDDAALTGSL
jgi:hypothetical protein